MTPDHVREAFAFQAEACRTLGSPFMGQLCILFATRDWPESEIKRKVFAWQGDLSPRAESVPLRLAGALHALYLTGRAFEGIYPPASVSDDTLWDAVKTVLVSECTFICDWVRSAPQTNEVRRSAVLIAIGHVVAERFGLPIRMSELGASGGLNLMWDRFGVKIGDQLYGRDDVLMFDPEWSGDVPPLAQPDVVERRGVDLNPLDPTNPDDALRLQAYLWPDQPDRLQRTRAAISVAQPLVDQADAIAWLEHRLPHQEGLTHLIYSTVAWQYFPAEARARGRRMI